MTEKRRVYLDHSATTRVYERVVEAMLPYFTEEYGNPNSLHQPGQRASGAIENARRTVAGILNCAPREIAFTGCGTESDNLAIRGAALAQRKRGGHIITTPIEHEAVLQTAEQLEQYWDYDVTYLPVDRHGRISVDDVKTALRSNTVLVSIMYANNEVGTIEPLAEIGELLREREIVFHTDAVQAGGYLSLDVDALNVDMLSLSGHKFHAPKGVGVLYIRRGTPYVSTMTGGGHENGKRSGTQNVPSIVGLATALELAHTDRAAKNARLVEMRDRLVAGLRERIEGIQLSGHPTDRLPGHASFTFDNIEADGLLLGLDLEGIAASSGSACSSGAVEPSHVLEAMGVEHNRALSALRLTLGDDNEPADVGYALDVIPTVVQRLQTFAPA